MPKTKILISGNELHTLKDSGKYPCSVCRKGVGSNSIQCGKCNHWVHKKCSGIQGRLSADPTFTCKRCTGEARPIDARPIKEVTVGDSSLQVVDSFCYLGDMLSAGGGCELSSVIRVKTAWGKFRQLRSLLTSRSVPLPVRGKLYSSCVRSVMLHHVMPVNAGH